MYQQVKPRHKYSCRGFFHLSREDTETQSATCASKPSLFIFKLFFGPTKRRDTLKRA